MIVRLALSADSPRITELYRQLTQDLSVSVSAERITQLSQDANTSLWACEMDGIVVGTAMISICADVMYNCQPFAVIENVIVDKGEQAKGIGAALLRNAEAYCLSKDCSKIMLLSSSHRTAAHLFFERMGFDSSAKRGLVKYRRDFYKR
ncbi:GCN5 family acetyltransferase [Herbaspirillum rubrisubalbicans]|nr:GCN5 family acetyltransferase [Herbaspirillum rubrisubalbicans]